MIHRRCVVPTLLLALACVPARGQDEPGPAYGVEAYNPGLTTRPDPLALRTPRSTLETFFDRARAHDWVHAATALDLSHLDRAEQQLHGPRLAQQLHYVLNKKLWLDWEEVPDLPDGSRDVSLVGADEELMAQPRRSVRLGTIELDDRVVTVRLRRVRSGETGGIWVFSPFLVDRVEALYRVYGPGLLEARLPPWAKTQSFWRVPIWEWIGMGLLLLASLVIGWVVRKPLVMALQGSDKPARRQIADKLGAPVQLLASLLAFRASTALLLSLAGPVYRVLDPLLVMAIIGATTWLLMRVIDYFSGVVVQRLNDEERRRQRPEREMTTQITVARQVLLVVAFFVGLGVALSQFEPFRTLGVSLLASAGVASVVLGVGAHSVLGNLVAGMQLAITQPVRLGDNVMFEGQWGTIEEVAYTYLTICTWDHRRVVIPLKYFFDNPIENWSKVDEHLVKPILLYVDYRVDVERLRDHFAELVAGHALSDGEQDPTVQVVELSDETATVRCLCGAADPSRAWDLHCDLRERMLAYLRSLEGGAFLPRRRLELPQGLPLAPEAEASKPAEAPADAS